MANTADNSPHVFPGFRIGDIYRLYDDDRLEEFADAAIEILNNRDDNRLSRLHRIQLMAMLVCVMDDFNFIDITYDTACREMDILKSNSGSYAHNPNYGPHIQRLEQTLESAHQVLERRRVELFGEEEAEVEDEDNSEEDNSEDTELPSSDGMDIDMMPSSETSSHVPASSATELSSEEVKADDLVLPHRSAPRKMTKFGASMKLKRGRGLLDQKKSIADLQGWKANDAKDEADEA